jgi:hypothetical protein
LARSALASCSLREIAECIRDMHAGGDGWPCDDACVGWTARAGNWEANQLPGSAADAQMTASMARSTARALAGSRRSLRVMVEVVRFGGRAD